MSSTLPTTGERRGGAENGTPTPPPPPPSQGYRVRFVGDDVDGRPDWRAGGRRPDGGAPGHGWPWNAFDGPAASAAARLAAVVVAVAVAWYLLRVNVDDRLTAVPGGSAASVFALYVAGVAAGRLTDAVGRGRLPPLLGMMVAGIALQNCGLYTVTDGWCVDLVVIMR